MSTPNEDFAAKQRRINDQWKKFATTFGREAYEDLMEYADAQREMFRKYGEDMAMPHPKQPNEVIPLNEKTIASLLQTGRGINIMKTYITTRANVSDVAQPTKSK